jgi:hypothetical protein
MVNGQSATRVCLCAAAARLHRDLQVATRVRSTAMVRAARGYRHVDLKVAAQSTA